MAELGPEATELHREAARSALEAAAPLRRTATADTVAQAVLTLLAGADLVTGETLMVDGGNHLMQAPLARR